MRRADAVTLIGGAFAGASLIAASLGDTCIAIKLLFFTFLMDVFDGWIARRYDSPDSRGQMLDRVLDRVSQILIPLIIFVSFYSKYFQKLDMLLIYFYAIVIVPAIFYRLVYRSVSSLNYFPGTPLFVHSLVLLGSVMMGEYSRVIVLLLVLSALGTAFKIPYVRRMPVEKGEENPSPGVALRAVVLVIMILLPCTSRIWIYTGRFILIVATLYALIGWALVPRNLVTEQDELESS